MSVTLITYAASCAFDICFQGSFGGGETQGNRMAGGGGGGGGNQMNNTMAGMNQMNSFQMGLMNQNQGMGGVRLGGNSMSGDNGGMSGGGGSSTGGFNHMTAPQAMNNNEMPSIGRKDSSGSGGNDSGLDSATSHSVGAATTTSGQSSTSKTPEERAALLQKLKDDIAKRERDMAELEASLAAGTGDGEGVDSSSRNAKRVKKDEDDVESAAV